jgi:hypothetical protein
MIAMLTSTVVSVPGNNRVALSSSIRQSFELRCQASHSNEWLSTRVNEPYERQAQVLAALTTGETGALCASRGPTMQVSFDTN